MPQNKFTLPSINIALVFGATFFGFLILNKIGKALSLDFGDLPASATLRKASEAVARTAENTANTVGRFWDFIKDNTGFNLGSFIRMSPGTIKRFKSRVFDPFSPTVRSVSTRLGLPSSIVFAIAFKESSGNTRALGAAGEAGLMQIKPGALADVNKAFKFTVKFKDLFDIPTVNLWVGAHYLALMRDTAKNIPVNAVDLFGGQGTFPEFLKVFHAIRLYNAGPGEGQKNLRASMHYALDVINIATALERANLG